MRNPNVKAMATKAKAFVKPITNTTTSFFSGLSKPEKIAVTAAAVTGTVTAIGTKKMIDDLFPSQEDSWITKIFKPLKRSKEGGSGSAAVPNTEDDQEQDDPRDDDTVDLDGST